MIATDHPLASLQAKLTATFVPPRWLGCDLAYFELDGARCPTLAIEDEQTRTVCVFQRWAPPPPTTVHLLAPSAEIAQAVARTERTALPGGRILCYPAGFSALAN